MDAYWSLLIPGGLSQEWLWRPFISLFGSTECGHANGNIRCLMTRNGRPFKLSTFVHPTPARLMRSQTPAWR